MGNNLSILYCQYILTRSIMTFLGYTKSLLDFGVLALILSVWTIKDLVLVVRFQIPLVYVDLFVIPAFFFRIKGYINFVSKSLRRPSVCPSVRAYVRPSRFL